MRNYLNLLPVAVLFILLLPLASANVRQNEEISPEAFAQDIAILRQALTTLHPGLYRYQNPTQVLVSLDELTHQSAPLTTAKAYLKLTAFAAGLRCSHTHTNPWNLPQSVKDVTSEQADKWPLTISFFENASGEFRFYVNFIATNKTSGTPQLKKGTEILAINGIAVNQLMQMLEQYVAVDGFNPVKALHRLSMKPQARYQWLDILLPLLAPPTKVKNGWQYSLDIVDNSKRQTLLLASVSAKKRGEMLAQKYAFSPKSDEDKWPAKIISDPQNNKVAILKMETFATYKMTMDWRSYLDQQFARFAEAKTDKLILDIRGNEGGMYEVAEYLYPYIINKTISVNSFTEKVRYKTVPESLRPYLQTWNPDIYDIQPIVGEAQKDLFLLNSSVEKTYHPNGKNSFKQVILLTDAANSSATFIMARALKQSGQAILVGETLGGNARGQNGGQMFFLKLPNSKISIDVPLIGFFDEKATGEVILPDVPVSNSFQDWVDNKDRILQTALRMKN